jgi:hypothetical protein
MHIKEVTFTKIYANSSFLNDRIGVTVAVNEGEDAKEALRTAAMLSDEFHKERNPDVYKHNDKPLTAEETSLLEDIKNATDVKKLGMLKNHLTPALKPYYVEKLKTLTDNFKTHD